MDRVMAALMVVADEHPMSVVDLNFALVRPSEALRPSLREDLLKTWVAVTETGGCGLYDSGRHRRGCQHVRSRAAKRGGRP